MSTFFKKCSCGKTDLGLLILRIGVGGIFIFSGWAKASSMEMTVGFFATMGFSAFWAYLVTVVEIVGGLAVILGVFTHVAAKLLSIVMIVAIYETRHDMAMFMTPLTMLFSTLALMIAGSGKYSLMRKMCSCGNCENCENKK